MVIKEKNIKSHKALENALRYILSKSDPEKGFVLTRYIRGDKEYDTSAQTHHKREVYSKQLEARITNIKQQFVKRNALGKQRKNGVKYYHTILSLSNKDHASKADLLKIARKYIRERFPDSYAVFLPHFDQEHLHLHGISTATDHLGEKIYLTRKEFRDTKLRMSEWSKKHLLHLTHSNTVDHSKKKTNLNPF